MFDTFTGVGVTGLDHVPDFSEGAASWNLWDGGYTAVVSNGRLAMTSAMASKTLWVMNTGQADVSATGRLAAARHRQQ